jgi:Mrp family chromosome partitioning ATPase
VAAAGVEALARLSRAISEFPQEQRHGAVAAALAIVSRRAGVTKSEMLALAASAYDQIGQLRRQ